MKLTEIWMKNERQICWDKKQQGDGKEKDLDDHVAEILHDW
jgi:hypothetical protein